MGTRFQADVGRVVEAAHGVARRHRHVVVEPVHLLRALASDDALEALFVDRGVDRMALAEHLEVLLATRATSGLYRDGAAAPTSSRELTALVDAASPGTIVAMVRPLTVARLARAAFADTELALLLCEAHLEAATADQVLQQARTLARALGHGALSFFHLLDVLIRQRWVIDVLHRADVDLDALTATLASRLGASSAKPDKLFPPTLSELVTREQVLVTALREPAVEELFWEQGVAAFDVLRALARGDAPADDDDVLPPDTSDDVDVIFENDEFTTMEFVVDVLCECFDHSTADATALMLRIHKEGSAVVMTGAARDARTRVHKALLRAERAAMPLSIKWTRVDA